MHQQPRAPEHPLAPNTASTSCHRPGVAGRTVSLAAIRVTRAAASSHVFQGPYLARTVEFRPMDPMQVHELARQRERLLARLQLGERVASDQLLRLGER